MTLSPPPPPSPLSRPRAGLAVALLLLLASPAWAEPSFPRGPGLYYSPVKLLVLVLTLFGWAQLCAWVDKDARKHHQDTMKWNLWLLLAGVGGFLVIWLLPMFWLAWIVFWGVVGGTMYAYSVRRNPSVDDDEKIMTPDHIKQLLTTYLKIKFKSTPTAKAGIGVPVRILSRGPNKAEEGGKVTKVQQSRGYKAALAMVYEAIQRRATDIHMEPTSDEMAVRYRIDGVMVNATSFSRMMGDSVVNIFKVICNMDITEKRKPQDGSFSAQVESHVVEFRVATAGSVAGEKMVMRILDSSQQLVELQNLGMSEDMRDRIRELVTKPHGLFLVCGPTGAGKSTTLYACLHEIDRYSLNVITVENPVEYRLDNVTQIEINPKAGKTFAGELRSILRQDPDVIMVGEIRDKETAEIACQAAQTGHMVFSTLHANDTATAIARLIDLGVPPFMIGSALTGVLGQRLVRKLCPKCRKRFKPNNETVKRLGVDGQEVRYLYRPPDPPAEGSEEEVCEHCGGTGYFKRTGVYELLTVNDRVRPLIKENPDIAAIRQEAVQDGFKTLFEDGTRLVLNGTTSLQELLRVSK